MSSTRLSETGFTLIEVLIALGIVALALSVLLGLFLRDLKMTQEAQFVSQGTLLLQRALTSLQADPKPPTGELSGTFPAPHQMYRWTRQITVTPFRTVRQVMLRVSWPPYRPWSSVGLTTYVYVPAAGGGTTQ